MEGYSVTEAASVLGVPTERVWELLARGILSGASDGETGMRVFLQPRPAPQAVDEPRRSNGHGNARDGDAEASPFRELLTEFRGLTERYGQALLALGEARGEVASLRSRVDVLEARMDLRLPFSSPMTSEPTRRASDRRPPAPADAAEHDMSPEPEAAVDIEPDAERTARRKRSRAHFSDEFADALARAEDPSPAVLPEAPEAEKAVVDAHHGRDETPAEPEAADWALPRELPAAEAMEVAEPESEFSAQGEEPERMADPQSPEPEPEPEPALEAEPEPEPALEAEPEPSLTDELASEPEPESQADHGPPPALVLVPDLPSVPEPELEVEPEAEPEPTSEPAASAVPDLDADIPEEQPVAEAEPAEEPDLDADIPEQQPVAEAQPAEEPHVDAEMPELVAEGEPVEEPDLVAGAMDAPLEEAEPAADVAPDSVMDAEPEHAPRVDFEPDAAVESELAAAAPSAEASWDQETYSARIEEPDWWTPEESLWPEPEASSVSAPPEMAEELQSVASEREQWAGPDFASGWPAEEQAEEPAAPDELEASAESGTEAGADPREPTVAATADVDEQVASPQSYLGEETMLWFGRRPDDSESSESPPEDAAGEMEVASTGHRGRVSPERPSALPGGEELDDALAGLDSLVGQRGASVPGPGSPAPNQAQPEPPPIRPRVDAEPVGRPPQLGVPSGPATRAYRRLRRIFPG